MDALRYLVSSIDTRFMAQAQRRRVAEQPAPPASSQTPPAPVVHRGEHLAVEVKHPLGEAYLQIIRQKEKRGRIYFFRPAAERQNRVRHSHVRAIGAPSKRVAST